MLSPGEWLWDGEPMREAPDLPFRADQVTVARVFAAGLFDGSGCEEDVAVVAEPASGTGKAAPVVVRPNGQTYNQRKLANPPDIVAA